MPVIIFLFILVIYIILDAINGQTKGLFVLVGGYSYICYNVYDWIEFINQYYFFSETASLYSANIRRGNSILS